MRELGKKYRKLTISDLGKDYHQLLKPLGKWLIGNWTFIQCERNTIQTTH